jgi:membrane protease YdiL (CAAX protease family)
VLVSSQRLTWRPAPGWPEAPPGWVPPPGWKPPPDWPPAPPGWQFWTPADPQAPGSPISAGEPMPAAPGTAPAGQPLGPGSSAPVGPPVVPGSLTSPPQPAAPVVLSEQTRSGLVLETRLVMIAGLFPWVVSALVILGTHLATGKQLTQLPTYTPHEPVLNTVLGLLSYLPVAAVVPLVLLLLARTGQRPASLGLTRMGWVDFWVAVGIAAAAFGCELVLAVILGPLDHSRLVNSAGTLHVPTYYLIFGLSQALFTAVAEEVIVNGYLITRLDQLGWSPARAFWLSLALRTSYHLYYGLAVIFTIPFGWLVTRSFQKHRRLARPIVAHFLFDATAFTIAILIAGHH